MKILKFNEEESWLAARVGKITGTRLGNLISRRAGSGPKKGFYELIAERVATTPDNENPMDRGKRLEEEGVKKFEKETGKKVDSSLVMWVSDDDENMTISPDGAIGKSEALEVKCLNSANHIEAWLTKEIPSEFEFQKLQYFIINPDLKKLHFSFYDPRIPSKDFFFFTFNRKDLEEDIQKYKEEQLRIIKEVEKITNEIVGF